MNQQDARFQRYADIFEEPETADSIERGWRVLHWEFTEARNLRETVTNQARRAQQLAKDRK
jgi:hypothetical protein